MYAYYHFKGRYDVFIANCVTAHWTIGLYRNNVLDSFVVQILKSKNYSIT